MPITLRFSLQMPSDVAQGTVRIIQIPDNDAVLGFEHV